MLKTPLPEKMPGSRFLGEESLSREAQTINQLITYLAELTEVVEGKSAPVYQSVLPASTLKEQLLGEIKQLSVRFNTDSNDWVVNYKEVEAIINRLIP